jgi:biopolymer transport protein ExbB
LPVVLVLVAVTGVAWAAGDADAGRSAATATSYYTDMSIKKIMNDGGWLMYVLALLSFLTVALIVYCFIVLREPQVTPKALHRELTTTIRNGDLEAARRACERQASPLGEVALAGIDYISTVPNPEQAMLKDVIEGEGVRQADAIQGQTQYLLDIAVVAPMVGLLGTIFGMLQAFDPVALNIESAKPVALAGGISKALLTTAFGLIVGIPAMALYAYFRRKASQLVSSLEAVSTEVMTLLCSIQVRTK